MEQAVPWQPFHELLPSHAWSLPFPFCSVTTLKNIPLGKTRYFLLSPFLIKFLIESLQRRDIKSRTITTSWQCRMMWRDAKSLLMLLRPTLYLSLSKRNCLLIMKYSLAPQGIQGLDGPPNKLLSPVTTLFNDHGLSSTNQIDRHSLNLYLNVMLSRNVFKNTPHTNWVFQNSFVWKCVPG